MLSERAAWFSVISVLMFVMLLGALQLYNTAQCKQSAISQNYPADTIKKICK